MVLAARRQWSEATPYAVSAVAHAALLIAASWGLTSPIVVRSQNAIDVEIIDQKAFAKSEEPPVAVPRAPPPPVDAGSSLNASNRSDADLGKPFEPSIQKPRRIENGWYRSETMLSEAEISGPKQQRLRARLGQLESGTRTIQICDLEAILQITRSGLQYHPEAVVAYAMSDVVVKGDMVAANGAAFQSEGAWYNLSFRCRISSRSQKVEGFEFAIGQGIPRNDWDAHGLPSHPAALADD